MMKTKKNLFIYMIDFLCQIDILLLNMLKFLKSAGFSRLSCFWANLTLPTAFKQFFSSFISLVINFFIKIFCKTTKKKKNKISNIKIII